MSKRRLAVIDFETDPFLYGREPAPFAAGFFDGEDYIEFWGDDCHIKLAELLAHDEYLVYAHNGGKFDFYYLLDFLDNKRLKIINGRIAECHLGLSLLRDSYLILPLALKAHDKGEIDYAIMEREERDKSKNKKLIQTYLERDCRSLYSWVEKFRARFGNGLTLAGRAFNELKKTGYDIPQGSAVVDEIYRPFYYGGRVQAFELGEIQGPLTYLDINSAYPFAMMAEHPWMAEHPVRQKTLPDLPKDIPYFAKIKAISKGCLPYRDDENKLQFPSDDVVREYNATGWEIRAGIETGTLTIVEVVECLIPPSVRNFSEYVTQFYEEKKASKAAGDKDNETFAKLMLNSAYGKMGSNPENYKDYYLSECGEAPAGPDWEIEIDLTETRGKLLWSRPSVHKSYYNVATAASITGYVRAYLWRAICNAERPIYCDTDSLICESYTGTIGKDLGQWKVEAFVDKAYIGGRKMYALKTSESGKDEWKTATKGFRPPSPEILAEHIAKGVPMNWQNDAPAFSLKGASKTHAKLDKNEAKIKIEFGAKFVKRKITPETAKKVS